MNQKDKEAFEKFFLDELDFTSALIYQDTPIEDTLQRCWKAALEYERERSNGLVEALEKIATNWSENYREEAYKALAKYKGEV